MPIPLLRTSATLLLLLALGACSSFPGSQLGGQESRTQRSQDIPYFKDNNTRPAGSTARRTALPVRPIDADMSCQNKDELGTTVRLSVGIEKSTVQRFSADVQIPKRGKCRFDLKSFKQTASLPAALLSSKHDRCSVRFWEQGEELTVAFSNCEAYCTGDSFSYLWPILADKQSGKCT